MSDLVNRNAEATKQGLEGHEARLQQIEAQMQTFTNQVQTLINLVAQLQQSNNMALQKLRGGGPTGGDDN